MVEALKALLGSASKLVFLLIAATVCVAYLTQRMETKDFMVLSGAVFTYYFSYKGSTNPEVTAGK